MPGERVVTSGNFLIDSESRLKAAATGHGDAVRDRCAEWTWTGYGRRSGVMKRMAAPIIGGLVTSFALELLIYPVIYETWKWHRDVKPRLADLAASGPRESPYEIA